MSSLTFSESTIDALLAEVDQCSLPGAAIGIAIGGKPVYRKGFGLASLELPAVLSPSIRMRIYSITRHFTCLAYVLLCEDGKAGIDDPIGKHLPELHPVARDVSVRHLMTNTSGLRDAEDILWQFNGTGRNVTVAELLSLYRDIDDMNFPPGTQWTYNNGGFVLLTAAVERIAGMSMEEILRHPPYFRPGGYARYAAATIRHGLCVQQCRHAHE
jgi:CubicO group peptidase (beta-lactamase class C family)